MNNCSTVIFGGTFNPPHIAHEQIVKTLSARDDIKSILIVPTGEPVHKTHDDTDKIHRKNISLRTKFSHRWITFASSKQPK